MIDPLNLLQSRSASSFLDFLLVMMERLAWRQVVLRLPELKSNLSHLRHEGHFESAEFLARKWSPILFAAVRPADRRVQASSWLDPRGWRC